MSITLFSLMLPTNCFMLFRASDNASVGLLHNNLRISFLFSTTKILIYLYSKYNIDNYKIILFTKSLKSYSFDVSKMFNIAFTLLLLRK